VKSLFPRETQKFGPDSQHRLLFVGKFLYSFSREHWNLHRPFMCMVKSVRQANLFNWRFEDGLASNPKT